MTEPAYIERIQPDPDGLDFEGLKQKGLELLQDLSGKAWTDYNLHDPGVTILEVLCYALTDLVYRTEFEVVDFLTGTDESIDFEKQALFRAPDIFPSQAVTVNDYRKQILDSTDAIDNVWITPVQPSVASGQNDNLQGLYCISVMLAGTALHPGDNQIKESDRLKITENVRSLFLANRNLCEDLLQVSIIEPDYYSLQGTIEIGGLRNAADILAEIYFKSAKYLSPGLEFQPYDAMLRQGKSLEEIFTGPLTEHGYISSEDLDFRREYAQASEMIGIISDIEGVKYVDTIAFEDRLNFIEYDRTLQSMPYLRFPAEQDEIEVKLEKNGRAHPVELNKVRAKFKRLCSEDRALRSIKQDIAGICDLPAGENRNFSEYYSIQNHFPEIYGIGRHGLSERSWQPAEHKEDSDRRRARARQLKAYLLIFEQTMANCLANLQNLSRLYSVDESLNRSYFHQVLDRGIIPGVDNIYREKVVDMDDRIAQLLGPYDNFRNRRNRILDYLLGLYCESFTHSSLRRFNEYHSEHKFDQEMILNKITLLKEIRELSRQRAGAFNYLKKSWKTKNASTLQKKVNILLGLRNFQSRSLALDSDKMDSEGCHILEHILLRPLSKESHEKEPPRDFYSFKISVLFPAWTRRFANKEFRKLAEETVELNCPAHVLPEFYWLDYEEMKDFEELYQNWLGLKCYDKENDDKACNDRASDEDIDEASQALIKFLIGNQEPESNSKNSTDQR